MQRAPRWRLCRFLFERGGFGGAPGQRSVQRLGRIRDTGAFRVRLFELCLRAAERRLGGSGRAFRSAVYGAQLFERFAHRVELGFGDELFCACSGRRMMYRAADRAGDAVLKSGGKRGGAVLA